MAVEEPLPAAVGGPEPHRAVAGRDPQPRSGEARLTSITPSGRDGLSFDDLPPTHRPAAFSALAGSLGESLLPSLIPEREIELVDLDCTEVPCLLVTEFKLAHTGEALGHDDDEIFFRALTDEYEAFARRGAPGHARFFTPPDRGVLVTWWQPFDPGELPAEAESVLLGTSARLAAMKVESTAAVLEAMEGP